MKGTAPVAAGRWTIVHLLNPGPDRRPSLSTRDRVPSPPGNRASLGVTLGLYGVGDALWSLTLVLTSVTLWVPLVAGSTSIDMTLAVMAVSLTVLTLSRVRIHRNTLRRAIRQRQELTELTAHFDERVDDSNRALAEQIRGFLDPAIDRIHALLDSPGGAAPSAIIWALTSTVTEIVRPLTQRLSHPVTDAVSAGRLRPRDGRLPIRGSRANWRPGIFTAVLCLPAALLVVAAAGSLADAAIPFWVAVSQWLGLGVIVSFPWIALQLSARDASLAAQVDTDLEQVTARLRRQLWMNRRNLTWVIHGPIQSALVASALALSQSENTPELRDRVGQNLTNAVARLDSALSAQPDLDSALAEISAVWSVNCAVVSSIDEPARILLASDRVAVMCIGEIVREAVNNAVRHGHARAAHVRISASPPAPAGILYVTVTNNGEPISARPELGLGSAMFDELTQSWTRLSEDGWTTLTAAIPTRSP